MAGVISESIHSRPFTLSLDAGRELIYDIVGTDDEDEVRTLLLAAAPAAYSGLIRESISAEPQGGGVWRGSAKYKRVAATDEYTFDTGGGTQKITQSLDTVIYSPSGSTAPDFGGAIGVTSDSVEGVDAVVPAYEFTETHYLSDLFVNLSYKLILFNLTGCMNDAPFKGFASGECQFLGATGGHRGDDSWQITFRFSCQPNTNSLMIGDIGPITKRGWDYLWVRYADIEDTSAHFLVKRPIGAYVEQVLPLGDFSTLGIGT